MNDEKFRTNVAELCERLDAQADNHEQKARMWAQHEEPVMEDDETLREFRIRQEEAERSRERNQRHAHEHQFLASDLRQAAHVLRMQNNLTKPVVEGEACALGG